ncbi:MAG: hypothetical protein M3342_24175 [Bacteroidota bacterium]|nr:hypothetical protein [Flavisolibacter sp.]MBD0377904.1 hypothetical protein [Flavisolibacter sp.]MDQ3847084.1 hypothetical protein [Bacteroidota bacterium]
MDCGAKSFQKTDELKEHKPPLQNGTLTVGAVLKAESDEEVKKVINDWAKEIWNTWEAYHETIRSLALVYT